jgi:type III pantothenate kinase
MNLCIDIGNTLAKTAVFSESSLEGKGNWAEIGPEEIDQVISTYPAITNVIVCSVKQPDPLLVGELKSRFARVIEFDENIPVPVKNMYKTKSTLGKDRLAAAVGANNIYPGRNVLVIDTGTAITYDVVDEFNRYLGGSISPGMSLRFRALHEFTRKLPLVRPGAEIRFPADNTEDAVSAGVQNGIIFEIESYICRLKKQFTNLEVILTGGDALYFDKKLKFTIFVDQNLILEGLNRILTYNVDKI